MRSGRLLLGIGLRCAVAGFVVVAVAAGQPVHDPRAHLSRAVAATPVVASVEPTIVGVGTKIRIRGSGLGTAKDSAVEFGGGVVSTWVEKHTDDEIVVRVPIGAEAGPVRVAVGAGSAERLEGMAAPARRGVLDAAAGVASPQPLIVIAPFVEPIKAGVVPTGGRLSVVRNRLIVGLRDFRGFEDAAQIARGVNGRLAGFFGPSNSYVIDLKDAPIDYAAMARAMELVRADGRVAEVCPDLVLGPKQVTFSNTDVVDRYRQMRAPPDPNINGREDVWHFDRCQAPAAWNLVRRFVPVPAAVKVAVLDTGCDQTHAEFAGVNLTQITMTSAIRLTLTGEPVVLPTGIGEQAYNRGDHASGHGTSVCSIIGAANGAAIPGAPNGDRGTNGLLAGGGGAYTMQVHRGASGNFPNEPGEPGETYALTDFLAAINGAALTTPSGRVTVLNASWGQIPGPIDPGLDPDRGIVRVALRKLARQLTIFQAQVLLCTAAGNEGRDPASYNGGEVTPFEDFNLNGVLDPGEDLDGDMTLDHGNFVAASLGTLPNVIAVGAIGGTYAGGAFTRNDALWDDGPGGPNASNWGTRRAGTTADAVVALAAPAGRECFVASVPSHWLHNPSAFRIGDQWYRGGVGGFGGTSAATPHVTGGAGLLLAIQPTLTPAQVKQRLIASSYAIDTTTTTGLALRWNTLKIGAAVRRLLVDRGTITNGQAWTGTSKVLRIVVNEPAGTATLMASEVRQHAVTRRSERFRDTVLGVVPLAPRGFPPPSPTLYPSDVGGLSWDGTRVAYEVNLAVGELNLATGATRAVRPDDAFGSWRIPYVANQRVMSARVLPELTCAGIPPGNPGFQSYWIGYTVFDEGAAFAVQQGAPPFQRWAWEASVAPKPDNKSVYAGYRILHFQPMVGEPWPCVSEYVPPDDFLGTTLTYPGGGAPQVLTVLPPPPDPHRFLADWSPDGRMFGASDNPNDPGGAGLFRARRLGPAGPEVWAAAMGHPLWSPDGSEILLTSAATRRRNGTEPVPAPAAREMAWSW